MKNRNKDHIIIPKKSYTLCFILLFSSLFLSIVSYGKSKNNSEFVEKFKIYLRDHSAKENSEIDDFTEASKDFIDGGYNKTNNERSNWRNFFKSPIDFKKEKINLIRRIKDNRFSTKYPNVFYESEVLGPDKDDILAPNERLFISHKDFFELFNLIAKSCTANIENDALIIKEKPQKKSGTLNDQVLTGLFTPSVIIPSTSKYEFFQYVSKTPSFGIQIFAEDSNSRLDIAFIRFHFIFENKSYVLYSDYYGDSKNNTERKLYPRPISVKGIIRESLTPRANNVGEIKCHLNEGGVYYF